MIAIITPMQEEFDCYARNFPSSLKMTKAGLDFFSFSYKGMDIVFVKCGIGEVNAALCTQIIIDEFKADKIICTGVAGAINDKLDIGDIVISKDCVHHDMDLRFLGFERGQIPFTEHRFFKADADLVCIASKIKINGHKSIIGRVLTGDNFVQDKEYIKKARDDLGGDCIEMESAAVGQVCAMNRNVSFIAIRSISDRSDHAAPKDFQKFLVHAAENAFEIVKGMIDQIIKYNAASSKNSLREG